MGKAMVERPNIFFFFSAQVISTAQIRLYKKKSRIRATKHLSTDADNSTDAIGGWTKNTPKLDFFKTEKIIQNTKTQKRLEICQNQRYALRPEVSNPSGSVVSGWTKNTQKLNFFENLKKSSKTQKLKIVKRYAKISDTPFDQRSLIHLEAWFPPCFVRQNQQKKNKKCAAILDHFQTKMIKCQTTSFHHFSPRIPNL